MLPKVLGESPGAQVRELEPFDFDIPEPEPQDKSMLDTCSSAVQVQELGKVWLEPPTELSIDQPEVLIDQLDESEVGAGNSLPTFMSCSGRSALQSSESSMCMPSGNFCVDT